jgi:hypothetical protein
MFRPRGVAALRRPALPVLPLAREAASWPFPRPGEGILAGQTSALEVASSQRSKSIHLTVERVMNRRAGHRAARQQRRLPAIRALNEALHPIPHSSARITAARIT